MAPLLVVSYRNIQWFDRMDKTISIRMHATDGPTESACVDRRAHFCAISGDVFGDYQARFPGKVTSLTTHLMSLTYRGKIHPVTGRVLLKINFSSFALPVEFLIYHPIYEGFPSVILGKDFIKSYHLQMDFINRILTFIAPIHQAIVCKCPGLNCKCTQPVAVEHLRRYHRY